MSKQFQLRLLVLFVCCAVLFSLFFFPSSSVAATPIKTGQPTKNIETASTQLLWESLSHQFFTNVQY